MWRRTVHSILVAVVTVSGCARRADTPAPPRPELAALVAAERAFAAASEARGMRDAFLAHLVPEAILFRPHPVTVSDWYRDRPSPGGKLLWQPDFAAVSLDGDLGYTSGPWAYWASAADSQAVAFGHFVSVWRLQTDGAWRVVLDLGNSHPESDAEPVLEIGPSGVAAAGSDAGRDALLEAERELASRVTRDGAPAYLVSLAADVRCLRDGVLPAVGRAAANELLAVSPQLVGWDVVGADIARRGDLGYTYGSARILQEGATRDTWYLHIWRRRADGGHEIVLDIVLPGSES